MFLSLFLCLQNQPKETAHTHHTHTALGWILMVVSGSKSQGPPAVTSRSQSRLSPHIPVGWTFVSHRGQGAFPLLLCGDDPRRESGWREKTSFVEGDRFIPRLPSQPVLVWGPGHERGSVSYRHNEAARIRIKDGLFSEQKDTKVLRLR